MRDNESGSILRVAVLLVQQRLRCCATVRYSLALTSLESCEYVHVACYMCVLYVRAILVTQA